MKKKYLRSIILIIILISFSSGLLLLRAQSQTMTDSDGSDQVITNIHVDNIGTVTIGSISEIVEDFRESIESGHVTNSMKTLQLIYEEIAKDPVIQRIYAPVLEKGEFRKYLNGIVFEFQEKQTPHLRELRQMGVVGDFYEFIYWMSGVKSYEDQDRPTWGQFVDPNGGFVSKAAESEARQRYELFSRLVDIWAKDGVLQR